MNLSGTKLLKLEGFILKNYLFILIFILILSLTFRIYSIEYGYGSNHFSKIDEVDAYEYSLNMYYFSHQRVLFRNPGPWQNLFGYLLIKIFNSVKALYYFVALIGVLNTFLLFLMAKKIFSREIFFKKEENYKNNFSNKEKIGGNDKSKIIENNRSVNFESRSIIIGLISSFIYAIYPWPVKYSNSFWNPYFIIPIIIWFLIALYKFIYLNDEKQIKFLIFSSALMSFFHMLAVFCFKAFVLITFIKFIKFEILFPDYKNIHKDSYKKFRINLFYIFLGILFSFIIFIPFIYFDYKNNLMLIKNYLFFMFKNNISNEGYQFKWVFHPEVFKIFSNPIIVMTNEISRFVGSTFNEYKYFLNRSFLFYPIGFIFILPSFIIVLLSFYNFFKNIKISSFDRLSFFFIIFTGIIFFIFGFPHEERFTVIWVPILIFMVSKFLYYSIFESDSIFNIGLFNKISDKLFKIFKKDGKIIFTNIIILFFIINSLLAIYLNFQHYRQERYPDVKNTVRLIPSLIFYEKLKYYILNHYFINLEKDLYNQNVIKSKLPILTSRSINPSDYLHYFNYKMGYENWQKYSIFYYIDRKSAIPETYEKKEEDSKNIVFKSNDIIDNRKYFVYNYLINPKYKYYISDDFFWKKWNKKREELIKELIIRFININSNIITQNIDEANYILYFVDKKFFENNRNIFENYEKIGDFPQFIILVKRIR